MMTTMEGMMDKAVLDDVIRRLLEGKGGKQVQLSESEIRQLCVNARQIFLSQPILLELRAPIRIGGQPPFSIPLQISNLFPFSISSVCQILWRFHFLPNHHFFFLVLFTTCINNLQELSDFVWKVKENSSNFEKKKWIFGFSDFEHVCLSVCQGR